MFTYKVSFSAGIGTNVPTIPKVYSTYVYEVQVNGVDDIEDAVTQKLKSTLRDEVPLLFDITILEVWRKEF